MDRPAQPTEVERPGLAAAIAFTDAAWLYLAVLPGEVMAYVMLIAVGFSLLPALPIVLALTERHAPEAESTAAGLIWLSGNLGSVVIATVIGLLVAHATTAFVVLAGVTLLALPALRWYAVFDRAPRRGLVSGAWSGERRAVRG